MGGLTPLGGSTKKTTGAKRVKIKKGASLNGLKLAMRPAIIIADEIWQSLGQELTITSGTDGDHSAGSLHYYGYAIDLRTRYFTQEEKFNAYCALTEELEYQGFNIFMHDTHIHIEYDRAKETEWTVT